MCKFFCSDSSLIVVRACLLSTRRIFEASPHCLSRSVTHKSVTTPPLLRIPMPITCPSS